MKERLAERKSNVPKIPNRERISRISTQKGHTYQKPPKILTQFTNLQASLFPQRESYYNKGTVQKKRQASRAANNSWHIHIHIVPSAQWGELFFRDHFQLEALLQTLRISKLKQLTFLHDVQKHFQFIFWTIFEHFWKISLTVLSCFNLKSFGSSSKEGFLEPVCCKKRPKIVPDQLLV